MTILYKREITYKGRNWKANKLKGFCLIPEWSRYFDDLNPETVSRMGLPHTRNGIL
jgi:hypothetical protein